MKKLIPMLLIATSASADITLTTVVNVVDTRATLIWSDPTTRTDGSAFTESEIKTYWSGYGLDNTVATEIQIEPTKKSHVITGLTTGTWLFSMRLIDIYGYSSKWSERVSKTVISSPPSTIEFQY